MVKRKYTSMNGRITTIITWLDNLKTKILPLANAIFLDRHVPPTIIIGLESATKL